MMSIAFVLAVAAWSPQDYTPGDVLYRCVEVSSEGRRIREIHVHLNPALPHNGAIAARVAAENTDSIFYGHCRNTVHIVLVRERGRWFRYAIFGRQVAPDNWEYVVDTDDGA